MSKKTVVYLISLAAFLLTLGSLTLNGQYSDHLSIKLDFDDSLVRLDATYEARVKRETDSVYFMLNPGFEIQNISSAGLTNFQLGQKEGRPFPFWLIKFDRKLKKDEVIEVRFEYSFDLKKQNHLNANWIELNVDKLWFPNYNDMDNKFSYDVSITGFPDSFSLVGHVDAVITRQNGTIEIKKTEPAEEILLLAGGDMKFWTWKDTDVTIFAHRETQEDTLRSIAEKVKNSIVLLNESFGASDPISAFTVVLRNTSSEELGFQFSRKNMIITGIDFNTYADLSHEVAHYWWSGADFINEPWLNESFANYSMYLVLEEYDPSNYRKLLERNRKRSEKAIPVIEASLFAPDAYNSYYFKGAALLKELEERVGLKKMEELLALRVEKDINSTAGFLEQLEKLTDSETRVFFEELLKK